jgi:S1-C subfamily serine protease
MTAFRIGCNVRCAWVCLALLVFGHAAWANELPLRKAATPSGTAAVQQYSRTRDMEPQAPVAPRQRIGISPMPYQPEPAEEPAVAARPERAQGSTSFPDIRALVKKVNASVVSIRMLDASSSWSIGNLGFSGDSGSKAMGYGSGFLISRHGHIITNEHVLRNGTQTEVELLNGQKYLAKVIYKDAKNDLALLKIDAQDLQPVVLGNSDSVELGEWVVGIGNPYGIGQSIMIGIVSAQRRSIPGSGYPPLIQIDAAMNLGNSGGPLFNMDGEVIGINTILLWKSQGIGFATPVNVARTFLERKLRAARLRAEAVTSSEPLGPVSDHPRQLPDLFNPLDPPWRFSR